MSTGIPNPELPRSTAYTDEEYKALLLVGYDGPCRCFAYSGIWDGHDVNPPCATVNMVRKVLSATKNC